MEKFKYIGMYFLKRFGMILIIFFLAAFINYYLLQQLPGDKVLAFVGDVAYGQMTDAEKLAMANKLGVGEPMFVGFFKWMGLFLRGDWGHSVKFARPVMEVIPSNLWFTFKMNIAAFLLSFIIAIYIGVKQAVKKGSRMDKTTSVITLFGIALPSVLRALLLLFIFAITFSWFPLFGYRDPDSSLPLWLNVSWHMALPIFAIMIGSVASLSRYVRASVSSELSKDYIRTAKAKGVSKRGVIWGHGFRNSLIPLITILGGFLPALFAGSVIIERYFGLPGLGELILGSIATKDFNVMLAGNMIFIIVTLVTYALVDILYVIADPRVRSK